MKKKFVLTSILLSCMLSYSTAQQQKTYKTYLVSTAHFDTQWNWDVRESIRDYLHRTMVQNFWLFEHFPHYVFNFESAQKYAWMKEYYPAEYQRVKHYIQTGRWNVTGSCWEATDPNIPSAESFFRNILYGQTFYKKEFGTKSNDIFLPDCFGFGYTLPTIAAHCGLKGFSTQKLQWRKHDFYGKGKKTPFGIGLWQGIDGARIMAVCDAGGYGTSYYYDDITTNRRIIDRSRQDPNGVSYTYYGVGDRGGSPTLPSVCSMEQALNGKGPVEVVSAKAGQLYEEYYPYENHPELPVWDGELLMDVHGVGCYTSQAAMKRFNRRNEQLADAAERLCTAAEVAAGVEYPAESIRENWHRFLWHQFHDDLTGTSIPRAYTFSWNDELIAQTQFAEHITTAAGAIGRLLDTNVKGIPIVVYNPVADTRNDLVQISLQLDERPHGIRMIAPSGEAVPAQLIRWEEGKAEILFAARVEPLSCSVYTLQIGKPSADNKLKAGTGYLENRRYKVELDENGDIQSVYDKEQEREIVQPDRPFRLALFTKNISTDYPAWELYKEAMDGPNTSVTRNVQITVEEEGPLRATLKVERSHQGSRFIQYISLTDGAEDDWIEVRNEIEWRGEMSLLKAEFPTTVSNRQATYDLGLGHIARGNNEENSYEVPGHQWADLTDTDGTQGVAILNDCKYGWDKPDDHTLRLTLLHTPLTGKHYSYQARQDHGNHAFRYAIVPHQGNAVAAGIARKADRFNQPLLAFVTTKHGGTYDRHYSLASCNDQPIHISSIKKAEDGDGYIIRIIEREGNAYDKAQIRFAHTIVYAAETNGIEERIATNDADFEDKTLTIRHGKAFQPRTFRIRFKKEESLPAVQNLTIPLPVNALALTPDELNHTGNFDRKGNSLPAELMPASIVSGGVPFKIENDPTRFNYLRANGDTICLPPHRGATKLFILATSIQDDRLATFRVDEHTYSVKIPYYSGFYGQWGWEGESKGFIKDVPLGYIATHTHSSLHGNVPYNFAYLYKIRLDIPENARRLILPRDAAIAVFAATLTDNPCLDTRPANEMRALPANTQKTIYTSEPMPYYKEHSDW